MDNKKQYTKATYNIFNHIKRKKTIEQVENIAVKSSK